MKQIRNTAVIFGECDSFEDVCKHINDLYEIVREQRDLIIAITAELQAKRSNRTSRKKKT